MAIFFGLSGTGKTTLSADPERTLIGDDEHGWGPEGVFNFEGGCYAKTIRLSHVYEPDIYSTTRRFGTILENVVFDEATRDAGPGLGGDDGEHPGRVPARLHQQLLRHRHGRPPINVIFLTADAFGVLPPISRLSRDQAMYHFISGYTAKLAGTEVGVKEPTAPRSRSASAPRSCPATPRSTRRCWARRSTEHDVPVWLVNTGWTGGPYGVGERMNIQLTRDMVRAALDGALDGVPDGHRPDLRRRGAGAACRACPIEVLQPRGTWADAAAYDAQARKLAGMFVENFQRFEDRVSPEVAAAGPRAG